MRLVIALLVCTAEVTIACPLEGYWKSNEEMTLFSIRSAKSVSEKQMDLFSKDFFGKLLVHVECDKFTTVMDGLSETIDYEMVSHTDKSKVIKYYSDLEGEVVKEAVIHDKCYSLSINGGQFDEYFCPVSKRKFERELKKAVPLQKEEMSSCENGEI